MKTLQLLILLLLATALSSCSGSSQAISPTWDKAHVASLHLQLVDPEYVQDIMFGADGGANASFGDKSAVTPTIIYWKISRGRLILSIANGEIIDELSLVSESDKYIIVRNKSGKEREYRKIGR